MRALFNVNFHDVDYHINHHVDDIADLHLDNRSRSKLSQV
jgi:hypothetical protein